MKTSIAVLALIGTTQAAASSSTTGQTTSGGQATCYSTGSGSSKKYWDGTAPTTPSFATTCGKATQNLCVVCPDASYGKVTYEPAIPIWKRTGALYTGNDAANSPYASGIFYGFYQDQYTKASQMDGAIDKIKWCHDWANYGPMIEYSLKSFCKGQKTDTSVVVGDTAYYQYYNNNPTACNTMQFATQGECITYGGVFRHNKQTTANNPQGLDYGIVGMWGFTSHNKTVTIGAKGYVDGNINSTPALVTGYRSLFSEKTFTLPQGTQRNRTCLTGIDIVTWNYGSYYQLRNINLVYNEGIRCGAYDLGISASIASLAIGLAAIGLM